MHLSLHREPFESSVDMTLLGPNHDSFSCSVNFFLKIIERLKQLPTGDPMHDSIGVGVELSKGIVHFRPTTTYPGSPKEEIDGITLTLPELMMIPEEDLEKLRCISAVSEYKRRMFPEGEVLTLDEVEKRFPWFSDCHQATFTDEEVLYFKHRVTSREELAPMINHAQKRHGSLDTNIIDANGNKMAYLAFDESVMTEYGKKKYESSDWKKDWETMGCDARFLVLQDLAAPRRVVIYEFELPQAT